MILEMILQEISIERMAKAVANRDKSRDHARGIRGGELFFAVKDGQVMPDVPPSWDPTHRGVPIAKISDGGYVRYSRVTDEPYIPGRLVPTEYDHNRREAIYTRSGLNSANSGVEDFGQHMNNRQKWIEQRKKKSQSTQSKPTTLPSVEPKPSQVKSAPKSTPPFPKTAPAKSKTLTTKAANTPVKSKFGRNAKIGLAAAGAAALGYGAYRYLKKRKENKKKEQP